MMRMASHDKEVLSLLHSQRTKRLMANLTEQRLQRRYRKSKTIEAGQEIYVKLINMLLESNYLAKITADEERLHEMLIDREIIDDAIWPVSQSLKISAHLGTALFYLILGWISSELELSDVDHYDIVTCYSVAPTEEGQMALIIKLLVQMIMDTATLRMHAEGCCEEYDRDLQFLLHNGGAGAIYARLKMLMDCGAMLYDINVELVIVNTLVMELPRLSRSRQVVFTRVLRHIAEALAKVNGAGETFKKGKYDFLLWRILLKGIIESGIMDLAYDDIELLRVLGHLNRKFDLSVLTRVLSQDTRSYVGDHNDLQYNRDLVGALYAMRKNGVHFDLPDTFNFADGNVGTLLLDRMSV